MALPYPSAPHPLRRHAGIAAGVVTLHIAALWALQQGLLQRAVEIIVPIAMVSEVLTPPAPKVETPPAPVIPPKPEPVRPVVQHKPTPAPLPPAPKPLAIRDTTPAPQAPTGATEPQPPAPPVAAPVAAAPAPAAPSPAPAPVAKVELPTKDADYLHNPPPPYPPMSFRLGEEGLVVVRVLIGTDGTAQDAQVQKSSGFDRLDQAAVKAARSWRYVPGKRGGVPEQMWVNVPVNWELRKN
ncbi:energy transducer TonB [Ramlibacter sp. G-1-2-2]|uniref:Energy transducer TonB n=1 Tax=Ramlibacter agri TaxID=2728837 RepID=A0A848H7Y9_9BURK|nr:energy transducer TonB [Ramlibacter agri]NML46052.1 energy transducer TonB [Ramlibacter agri]